MIGEILQAIEDEAKELLSGTGASVMLKTNFMPKKTPDNSGYFILLGIEDAPDSLQYPGGLTRMDWNWAFNSYNWEPDAYNDDHSGYSTSLLNFIDRIRAHFSLAGLGRFKIDSGGSIVFGKDYTVAGNPIIYNGDTLPVGEVFTPVENELSFKSEDPDNPGYVYVTGWLTPGMQLIFDRYGFQFTLTGLTTADAVEMDENGLIMGYKIGYDSTAFDNGTNYNEQDITLLTVIQVGNPPFSPFDPIS